jgi:hypothetical protein
VHRCLSEEQRGRVDTMVAHFAGALGAPVWTLLHVDSDWRWMLDRSDRPWVSDHAPLPPKPAGRLGYRAG